MSATRKLISSRCLELFVRAGITNLSEEIFSMRATLLRSLSVWCALLALLFSLAAAQNLTNGAVSGTVTDPSGAVIANATVTLKNRATEATTASHTNSTGYYTFPFVQPGDYAVTVSAPGFQSVSRNVTVS